ncbi:MAG: Oligoendopeptidase F, plasmid [Chlamydiae bacterium]|nr:Oligoendopeptidase F, plasmid [Chlamydiota bacterium]
MTETVKARKEVTPEDKWDVTVLYPDIKTWENEFSKITIKETTPKWPKLAAFHGRLREGTEVLKEALETFLTLQRELEKLYTYAHLRHDEDITDDEHKAAFQKISSLLYDFQQECAWFDPELLALPDDIIDGYLQSPMLAPYRFHLEKIVRMRPYTLSADKEELLAMAGKPFQAAPKAFSALNNADIKFGKVKDGDQKEHELSHGLYQLFLRSPDRTLRENAFKQMQGKYGDLENTLTELIYGEIQSHIFNAQARGFTSSLEAALYPKKIPESVYRSLIAAIRKGLPSLHKYTALRKKLLKLPELHLYDMYVPLVPQIEITMDYHEAEEEVIASVHPLGKEYQALLKKGLTEEHWVDRFENKNKRSGAYSSGYYDSYPYILMNYRGILRDAYTLAHEAGHSMHSLLSWMVQPYQYSRYPIFVAEVASTFNEELLAQHLLKKLTKKEERLFLINEKIEDIRATLFRQTMFAEFELTLHELVEAGTPLTPALLRELYYKLNCDYFGPSVHIDDEIAIEWARIPHFYYNFYVFQYATGISAALDLSEKVLKEGPDNYLAFLKGGNSLFPIDLLKLAGVDMTTSQPVEAAIRKFDALVTELESLTLPPLSH